MRDIDKNAVQKYLEKRWVDTGVDKDATMFFTAKRIAMATKLSLWQVKTQLRGLRSFGIVGYKWFRDDMNYCNCLNESQSECECHYEPFSEGGFSWYFRNWHKNKLI